MVLLLLILLPILTLIAFGTGCVIGAASVTKQLAKKYQDTFPDKHTN